MNTNSKLYTLLSDEFKFTNYQIKVIRYRVLSLLAETSKTLIMGTFFYYLGYLPEFLFAVLVLLILRTCTGGLHMKHYASCLFVTTAGLYTAICILPLIPVITLVQLLLLLLCLAGNMYAAPVVSCYRPEPDGISIKKSKIQATGIICTYAAILYVIPEHPLITVGFWIIILQSAQLIVAKILKESQRRKQNEEVPVKEVDVYGM